MLQRVEWARAHAGKVGKGNCWEPAYEGTISMTLGAGSLEGEGRQAAGETESGPHLQLPA